VTRVLTCLIALLFAWNFSLRAQDTFYEPGTIQDIHISFNQQNWSYVLDSLFINYGDSGRLIGTVKINGRLFEKAAVRYKGYSSWNESEIKNPLNIDLDYVMKNQNYQGHTKIELSNVIHDPSFVREVLAYEIARKYLPASMANFANVYVNDSLIGLYTNVEAVDKYFLAGRYGSSTNSCFKGEPETLVYPFGQNANLAYTHGDDSSGYMPFYKMESDAGWNDLFNLIRVLDHSTDSIDSFLNTDRVLWMHAFNYSLLNFDSYIGYSQNYYLYKDDLGRFNPIIWDLNMSFGSFRESDGSYGFLGLTIPKLKLVDPLQHLHFSISPRPLMTKLFQDDTLRKMYLAHIRTIMKENINNNAYYSRAKELQALIDAYVKDDPNKFYGYQDFLENIDTTVGGVGAMTLYPGLKNLMDARVQYLSTYLGYSREPVISAIEHDPEIPGTGKPLYITANVTNANLVFLAYRFNHGSVFSKVSMLDDGNSHDGSANDGIYGSVIQPSGNTIQYYIYAQNDTAGCFSPERAAYEFYTLQTEIQAGNLVINEVMATGDNLVPGEDPVNNDWIELFNNSDETIDLKGFSLDLEPIGVKWVFPETGIEAGNFLLVWADGVGGNHAGFAMPQDEAKLTLVQPNGQGIDSIGYLWQVKGKTTGRYPNGYGSFKYMEPSPERRNFTGSTPGSGVKVYPSPAYDNLTIEFNSEQRSFSIDIYDASGRLVYNQTYTPMAGMIASTAVSVDVSHLNAGMYIVKLGSNTGIYTKKFLIYANQGLD
jgi:hypothetical protein